MKVVVLISGNGSNLQAIMDTPGLVSKSVTLSCVISNEDNAYGIERAKARSIPTHIVSHHSYPSRPAFEEALISVIDTYQPDLIVLAGFMRILTSDFVSHYSQRILNIHPSLLPKYPGLHTHAAVIANKDTVHGVSIHFVTGTLDGGPLIAWSEVGVDANDTIDSLEEKIHQIEYLLYPEVIGWYAKGRLKCQGDVVYLDGVALPPTGKERTFPD